MNKKGDIMFWIMPVFMIAITVYLLLSNTVIIATTPKGEWQIDFLNMNYLEAQKKLLIIDSTAKNIGAEVAWELALKAGFSEPSECGSFNAIPKWNEGEKLCLPDVLGKIQQLMQTKLQQRLPENTFERITYSDKLLQAEGKKETLTSKIGNYTYSTSFSVDIGYSFEEYERLKSEAKQLLRTCKNELDLKKCLEETRLNYWKYNNCETNLFSETDRVVIFCVESPNFFKLAPALNQEPKLITYTLALDFSTTEGLAQEATKTETDDYYSIAFPYDQELTYKIYYTNYRTVQNGPAREIYDNILVIFNKGVFPITNIEECIKQKEYGKAYNCENKITFLVDKSSLPPPGEYVFGVTTTKNDVESDITWN